jgi:hypothetical protein
MGDTSAEMKVYITKTVNFGDKPGGCIAIAAARETAAMDEGEFREAAWFLQNRTYVDDATTGADSMDCLRALSGEMEAVAKRGGFEFKETLMSGDKEDENGEPHKVLGLIWETEADRLRVDVKLNLGAKKAGLHLMENVELDEEPEKALPEVITKRELWRVAQGQYDLLGLLCAFTIRFKILMRSIVEETSQKVTSWDDPVPAGTNEEFPRVVSHLGELRAITFPRAAKAQGGDGGQAHAADIRGWINSSQLRVGLPAVADGRRNGSVPTACRQDQGSAKMQDLDSKDGVGGGTLGREIGTEDPGFSADGAGGDMVLHRLDGRAGDDPQGVGDLPGVWRHESERDLNQVGSGNRVVLDPGRD